MLSQITLKNFRNLGEQTLQFAPGINLVLGENGSGKTSLLEAIYLLSMGRSFRSRFLKHVIQFNNSDNFILFAKTYEQVPLGIQFHRDNGIQIRLNSAPLKRLSELAAHLPLQYIPANCHQFFEEGPRYRRQILDWGVFHVKHDFNYHWQSYKKALSQRNAALKKKLKQNDIEIWDAYLLKHGMVLNTYRQAYLEQLLDTFKPTFKRICPEFASRKLTVKFTQGWNKDSKFDEILSMQIDRDLALGYTRNGPHAADWTIRIDDADPYEVLSRGQQKLFYIAICVAQIAVVNMSKSHSNSILLIDDISSELDEKHQKMVLDLLSELSVQCFISSTQQALSEHHAKENRKVFHVKQGRITENSNDLSPIG